MADRRRCAAALLLAGVLLTGCGGEPETRFSGSQLDNPFPAPDVELTDTEGEAFSLAADTDKRLAMVFFGYTNCADICHTVMGALASAMTRLDEEDREQVDVIFVTTDPARDDAQVLRAYLDRFDPSFIGLTSDLDTIVAVGRELAVGIDRTDPGGHTTQVTGIDAGDQAPVYWDQDTSSAEYAADIHTLLGKDD